MAVVSRRTISVNALFVGLCALIPIPFLDDVLRRVLMRGAYQAIAEQEGAPLSAEALTTLSRAEPLRLLGCVGGLLWYPIKKISKKILYFFAIKDALDWTAEAAVRGELVRLAVSRGDLPGRAEAVRAAMDAAWEAEGGSPVTRSLLLRRHGDLADADEPGFLPGVGSLARRGAGAQVVAAFVQALDAPEPPTEAAEPGEGPAGHARGQGGGSGAENRT